MSRAEREFDRSVRTQLRTLGDKLAAVERELGSADKIAAPHRASANQILTDLSTVLEKCEVVLRDHSTDTIRASNKALLDVSHILGQAHRILRDFVDCLDATHEI